MQEMRVKKSEAKRALVGFLLTDKWSAGVLASSVLVNKAGKDCVTDGNSDALHVGKSEIA